MFSAKKYKLHNKRTINYHLLGIIFFSVTLARMWEETGLPGGTSGQGAPLAKQETQETRV